MIHALQDLLPQWGPWVLALSAFLSGLMIPLPTSLLLMTAGALTGTGHLHLPVMVAAATLGATAGDLTAFTLARRLGPWLSQPGTRRAGLMARAQGFIIQRGTLAVFLSRWLLTPIGPATNYVAGAAGLPLSRFATASLAGELLWAILNLTLAHAIARSFRQHESAFEMAIALGVLLTVITAIGRRLWRKYGKQAI